MEKLGVLFSSHHARMRMVDLTSPETIDAAAATANLVRYRTLAGELSVIHAVENARHSACLTMKIAAGAGFFLAYDEANLFLPEDRILEPPERFWESLDPRLLVSIHFKQKSAEGVLSRLGPGRVDLSAILRRLHKLSYPGDLLLENAASENPIEEAKRSRDYLLSLAGS